MNENPCKKHHCHQCCIHTNMLLTKDEIKKISSQGYKPTQFTREKQGWIQLSNTEGTCFFHDGDQCTIYNHRPMGCRLYPIVYNIDGDCAIYDSECPYKDSFQMTDEKVEALFKLIKALIKEREQRLHNKK